MKSMKTLLAIASILVAMVSCAKKVEVSLSTNSIEFLPEGGSIEVAVTSNGDWTVTSNVEWLSISPANGSKNATIVVTASPNNGEEIRQGQITVATKDNSALLAVTQDFNETPFLRIEPNQINCDYLGGTFDVNVMSNIDWTLSPLPNGISASATSGNGNASISVTIGPIENDSDGRNVTLVFSGGTILAPLEISQSGQPNFGVTIDPTILGFGYEGGAETVAVTCEVGWTAEVDVDWITLNVTSGEGNAEVVVTAAESNVFVKREAYITFQSSVGFVASLYVYQQAAPDPHFLTVNPSEFLFGKEGGMQTLSIGCNEEWNIDLGCDWLSLSATSGTGDAEVVLTVEPNSIVEPRSIDFAVVSGDLIQRVTVEQEAGDEPVWVSLLPDTLSIPYTGATSAQVSVTSNTTWYLGASDWISNLPTSEMQGDATVYLIVDLNSDPLPRYGFVRAMHNGQVMAEIVVAQEGKPDLFEVDMTEVDVRPEGMEFTFHVTSNQFWMVNCDVEWIHFTPESGFGNGDVLVVVDAMTSTRPRIGHIVVKAASGRTITITVNQHE